LASWNIEGTHWRVIAADEAPMRAVWAQDHGSLCRLAFVEITRLPGLMLVEYGLPRAGALTMERRLFGQTEGR